MSRKWNRFNIAKRGECLLDHEAHHKHSSFVMTSAGPLAIKRVEHFYSILIWWWIYFDLGWEIWFIISSPKLQSPQSYTFINVLIIYNDLCNALYTAISNALGHMESYVVPQIFKVFFPLLEPQISPHCDTPFLILQNLDLSITSSSAKFYSDCPSWSLFFLLEIF